MAVATWLKVDMWHKGIVFGFDLVVGTCSKDIVFGLIWLWVVQCGVGMLCFNASLEWYHHVFFLAKRFERNIQINTEKGTHLTFSKRRVNSENQAASSRRAKDEEPVVCPRTVSKLIVETVKVIGYN